VNRGWPLALCVALLLAACASVRPQPRTEPTTVAASATIYVIRRDWHIDVAFAVDELAPPLSALTSQFPGVRYLVFGFGDRRYLRSRDRRFPNMVAALWPGPGLILLTALSAPPAQAFGDREVIALRVSPEQSLTAQAGIWSTLATANEGPQFDGPGPYEGSLYLAASVNYSALHTCNTWAAQILRSAGLAVKSRGVVFAGQLWQQVRRVARSGRDSPGQVLAE
jgi:Protein of unknown function (DUF2459)